MQASLPIDGDARLRDLLQQHYRRVYRYGSRVCHSAADAEDATQEAFIKLADRPDVQADASALPWLMSVVRNACLKLLARLKSTGTHLGQAVPLDDALDADAGALPAAEALHQKQMAAMLMREIAALPPNLREVLLMRDIEELDGPTVCARLALTEEAMKSRLHRGRKALRDAMVAALDSQLANY
ncbi:MAG: sigma-70 family RNA polymerase sigma factor [Rhizobacter sp.]